MKIIEIARIILQILQFSPTIQYALKYCVLCIQRHKPENQTHTPEDQTCLDHAVQKSQNLKEA